MQISAKADYAVRAMLELAMHGPDLVKADLLITHQGLPRKFVESILVELRRAGLVRSHRGADGGYALASPPSKISLGSILRAVDGPLAEVRGLRRRRAAPARRLGRGSAEPASRLGRDDIGSRPDRQPARARAADGRRTRRLAAALTDGPLDFGPPSFALPPLSARTGKHPRGRVHRM
jgi:Rrf2 family protein